MNDKEILEREHSAMMNQQAVERIKQEEEARQRAELAAKSEEVWFPHDVPIKLRDGKTYYIPPCTLADARRLMKLLRTVSIDAIILNFIPQEDGSEEERINNLFEILLMAFKNYPHIDREYLDRYVDLEIARQIIQILYNLNGLKK